MPGKQNLTVQLDVEIIRKAKVLAAERSTSVGRLVADEIERLVGQRDAYRIAKRQALATLSEGFHMGEGPLPAREELYDR